MIIGAKTYCQFVDGDGAFGQGWVGDDNPDSMPPAGIFDVLIDEPRGTVLTPLHPHSRLILHIPKSQRIMLWLALNYYGDYFDHGEIRKRANLLDEQQVYQTKRHLARLVGDKMLGRMILEGRNGFYGVKLGTWSFLWLRRQEDPESSDLLRLSA